MGAVSNGPEHVAKKEMDIRNPDGFLKCLPSCYTLRLYLRFHWHVSLNRSLKWNILILIRWKQHLPIEIYNTLVGPSKKGGPPYQAVHEFVYHYHSSSSRYLIADKVSHRLKPKYAKVILQLCCGFKLKGFATPKPKLFSICSFHGKISILTHT